VGKVTGKLQITLPRAIARRYGIEPGDDLGFEEGGGVIRLVPSGAAADSAVSAGGLDVEARIRLFDAATERQRMREAWWPARRASARGWTREALYEPADTD